MLLTVAILYATAATQAYDIRDDPVVRRVDNSARISYYERALYWAAPAGSVTSPGSSAG